jgi:hypothetical protein
MTNNGTALVSFVTGSAYGRENVFSEQDGDSTAITFYEIVQVYPATPKRKYKNCHAIGLSASNNI